MSEPAPMDQRIRAFLEELVEEVAKSVLRDLEAGAGKRGDSETDTASKGEE